MKALFFLLCLVQIVYANTPLKCLHLSFHMGCIREFEALARALDLSIDHMYIPALPDGGFDPVSCSSSQLMNIDHARADRIWNHLKETFLQYDMIITSDTTALSRIFLQNNFPGRLVIWVTNRFNYAHLPSEVLFPDTEFYDLLNKAKNNSRVDIISSCNFEIAYAKRYGVDLGTRVINAGAGEIEPLQESIIPSHIDKKNCFFIPEYHNDTQTADYLKTVGIPHYHGPARNPRELEEFKGIIHLPYSYCTIALFMNTQMGLPYFIPSKKMLKKLLSQNHYWHQDCQWLADDHLYELSEWYSQKNRDYFVYFDSWKDLKKKLKRADISALKKRAHARAKAHQYEMRQRWREILIDKSST